MITLRITGVDINTLRRLLAACSQNREDFGTPETDGAPQWAPRVQCEGPERFGVHVTRCSPSLAALLATITDGGRP